ncbi:MAG: hypothetical protein HYU00_06090 [Nitrosarchaeum sp.]|nr:hypothetical protein [Nitrosarchaeum sp.]
MEIVNLGVENNLIMNSILSNTLVLSGLLIEALGVMIVVKTSDRGFNFLLKHLNRTVDENWDNEINKVKKKNTSQTAIGIAVLLIGIFMQYTSL